MDSVTGVNSPSSPYQVTSVDANLVNGQEVITSVDVIGADGSISTLNYQNGELSIEGYTATQSNVLDYLDQLFKNVGSDNFLQILEAEAGLSGIIPTAAKIQSTYNTDVSLLDTANSQISALNSYNNALYNYGTQLIEQGSYIQQDQAALTSDDPTSTLNSDLSSLSTLISNFETQYPNGMSLSDFQSQLSSITFSIQNAYNNQNNNYNNAADSLLAYNSALQNYNNEITNPNPAISSTSYQDAIDGITNANSANAQSGGFFPSLPTPPEEFLNTQQLTPPQSTLTNGQYNISWPDASTYTFTESGTQVNSTALNNFLNSYTAAVTTAISNSNNMQTAVSNFINNDYTTQSALVPSVPPTSIPSLAVPSFSSFNNSTLQNVLSSCIAQLSSSLNLFTNQNTNINPTVDSQQTIDQNTITSFTQQLSTQGSAATPLGSAGGVAFIGLGSVSNFTAITSSFNSQDQNISTEAQTIPGVTNKKKEFQQNVSNYLQTAIGGAIISGTGKAYQDATGLTDPNSGLNGSLIALNSLESYNSILGSASTQATTVQNLANNSGDATLADQGTIPFTLTSVGQRAVLVAQDVGGDKGAFTASYLAGFTESSLEAYVDKGSLNSSQQSSVVSAQSSLVGLLTSNNVNFSFLQSKDAQTQVANAFQISGQQLQNLGYNVPAGQLANAQAAFYASLSSVSAGGNALSVNQVQSLLQSAIASNVTSEIPPNVVANSVILQFDQNQESYQIQVKNEFQQSQNLNTAQVAHFSQRLREAALGTAQQDSVDALVQSNKATDNNFAQELANAALNQQDNILGSQVLEGTPDQIPGTDLLTNTIVAKNDVTPVPTEKRTTFIPV